MKTLVIYTHPYEKSFNAAILDRVLSCLDEPDLIDLYADKFNPVMSREDLSVYSHGASKDPKVEKYQKRIAAAERLVFIFPIWWYDAPAMLRGFFDKVLLKDFAFDDSTGFDGLLDHEVLLFTTSGDRTAGIEGAVRPLFVEHLFSSIGCERIQWLNCEAVQDDHRLRKEFLDRVTDALKL
ncbi:MAG: NAD(P)H-dependent oxidoreductase [Spirochaetales bacterium]|nr:NAD(P)H-dependent oxidoreductase [Spirochaetales bacterium]